MENMKFSWRRGPTNLKSWNSMPLLDGFILTRKIKEDSQLKELAVILYSSIITKALRHKGEAVKADFQVAKPDIHQMAEKAIALIVDRKGKS